MKRLHLTNLALLLVLYVVLSYFEGTQSAVIAWESTSNKSKHSVYDSNFKSQSDIVGLTPNEYFFVSTTEVSWFAADYFCQSNGWKLVSIASLQASAQLDGFLQLYNINGTAYWTSGNRLADKKTWYWGLYNEEMTYTNWGLNNPETNKAQYCMYHKTKWFDRDCEKGSRFICNKYR